ncbi:MAG: sulfite exporter TauE/SafE family protein [Rhodothermales bacterium]|nr:sulfite exporter TauE/SafE family protein [Rhodothermales bacterium]
MTDVLLIVLAGVLGSAHCIGMCGGFPLMIAHLSPDAGPRTLRMGLYGIGKTFSYAVLGLLVGGGGAVMHHLMGGQQLLGMVLGGLLIVAGVAYLFGQRGLAGGRLIAKATGWLGKTLKRLFERGGASGALSVGVMNGLLPCPLVYAMLLKAGAAGSAWHGALTMALFGIGTLPALFGLAWAGQFIKPYWRQRINLATGLLLIALGIMTVLRSLGGHH